LAIPNIKVNNPATLFGQDVAEITVKWNKFQAYLDKTFAGMESFSDTILQILFKGNSA